MSLKSRQQTGQFQYRAVGILLIGIEFLWKVAELLENLVCLMRGQTQGGEIHQHNVRQQALRV